MVQVALLLHAVSLFLHRLPLAASSIPVILGIVSQSSLYGSGITRSVRCVILDTDYKIDYHERTLRMALITMPESYYCSIILPVYNEKDTIRRNILQIRDAISLLIDGKSFEIIIVDNGSTDGTESLVHEISSIPQVVYVRIPERGRGGALKKGFSIARGAYVGVLSIDRAWSEEFLLRALEQLNNGADIVYGPKTHPDSSVSRPIVRRIGSLVIRMLLLVLFGRFLPDTQCIKLFRASSVPFVEKLRNYNYFAETEFFLRGIMHGIPSVNIPVTVRDFRRDSKVRISSFIEYLREGLDFRNSVWRISGGLNGQNRP